MEPSKKITICIFAIFFSLLLSPGKASPISCAESLKGLAGVEVLVEELKADLENYNLTGIDIQTDVESKLREAGITILTKEENEKSQPNRKPYLYVKISSCKPAWKKEVIVFHIEMALKQQVTLPEHPKNYEKSFYAPTWYKSQLGAVAPRNISKIREAVNELTDKFIAAYLRLNPK